MRTLVLALVLAAIAPPRVAGEPCAPGGDVAFLANPRAPSSAAPLRIVAVAERPLDATLTVSGPDGNRVGASEARHGGPPYWWSVEVRPTRGGTYRAALGDGPGCDVVVDGSKPAGGTWPIEQDWNRGAENLFSAWVEQLFDVPLDQEPQWRSLHEVTRDPARNLLHDHLGLGEDGERGLRLEPDCADLPYFLRAYFAWKLGLPFGYSECSRGGEGRPPHCGRWHSGLESGAAQDRLARMQAFFGRTLAWGVQSGAGRIPAETDAGDLYPTRLSADTLRPGTVYADPYGHTLVVVRRVAQSAASGGLLLAVDAQPDGTVARKRYWRGNFLFAIDASLGSAGFKHFRPVVRDGGAFRPLGNDEIAADPQYGDFSLEQYESGVDGFYDRVDAVLSPSPLDPVRAFRETIDALDEQVRARIRSVANGEAYVAAHPGTIAMPEGAAIFETTGAWEDFATPARDLRLLIALDVVRRFPDEVLRRPARFAMAAGQAPDAVRAELAALLDAESQARRFVYVRSDGSPWTLTLGDVLARAGALEVAYDPNDCVEVRWGAPAAGDEIATCRRRAPAEQAARMARYRPWFRERRRPPR